MYFASSREMSLLDGLALERGLAIRQMMELAGWHMLELFRELGFTRRQRIIVCAGKGNKGGDGLAAARHLSNGGHTLFIALATSRARLKPDPAHHLHLLEEMSIPIVEYEKDPARVRSEIAKASVVLDALIGYSLVGAPRGTFGDLIKLLQRHPRVISYDVPSGLDAKTGEAHEPCVSAFATLTLALPKKAFQSTSGAEKSGTIYLADLGIPRAIYDALQKGSRPDFKGKLMKIRT